jgi:hypothetical protein
MKVRVISRIAIWHHGEEACDTEPVRMRLTEVSCGQGGCLGCGTGFGQWVFSALSRLERGINISMRKQ